MKIRSISLTNVRKFVGRTATLKGIGDGISVVSEANEFGKSTFFDALHALFFERFGSVAKPVKSLQPYAGGAVMVGAEIEYEGTNYLIEKRWLSQRGATVRNLGNGSIIALDGEAETWIASIIGQSREGPAGLLWVRQGVTSLDSPSSTAAEKAERERLTQTRRNLLSSVAGEIDVMTGGRRMDRVLLRCREDLAKLTTATGKPAGAWKAIQDQVNILSQDHAKLVKLCEVLVEALKSRRDAEEQISRLELPAERERRERDLSDALEQVKIAEAHSGKVEQAKSVLKIAILQHETSLRELNALEALHQRLTIALTEEAKLRKKVEESQLTVAELQTFENEFFENYQTASSLLDSYRSQLQLAHKHQTSVQAGTRVKELEEKIALAKKYRAEIETLSAKLAADKATPQWLRNVEQLNTDLVRLTATRLAQASQVTANYDGDVRILLDATQIPGNVPVSLPNHALLDLPGIGKLHVNSGNSKETVDLEAAIANATQKLAQHLSLGDAKTIGDAHELARLRQDTLDAEKLSKSSLSILVPQGIEELQQSLAEAQALAADIGADESVFKNPVELVPLVSEAQKNVDRLQLALSSAKASHGDARENWIKLTTQHEASVHELNAAEQSAGPLQEREERRLKAAGLVTQFRLKQGEAKQSFDALLAVAPDLATMNANVTRAKSAIDTVNSQLKSLGQKRAGLSATIEAQAAGGIEERRDEIFGELVAARNRGELYAAEVSALIYLRDTIEETRAAAKDAYFGPIQEELAPLLRILHSDAALGFDTNSMLPTSLHRGQELEDVDALSGGTQEQIAILTRLAFANLMAKQGKTLPIILDDALVYSDDSRIIKMFTALHRVATSQQIIVFTCRQLAFVNLGGTKPVMEIVDVV